MCIPSENNGYSKDRQIYFHTLYGMVVLIKPTIGDDEGFTSIMKYVQINIWNIT